MADAAQATVTIPGVTPDTGIGEQPGPPVIAPEQPGGWGPSAPSTKATSRSPLQGLRALSRPRSKGGGGGGRRSRPTSSGGAGGVDVRNTWQIVAGSILIPLGVVFILMAWYGSAHTAYVQQQIPYLVSGSFAGLACIVLGGLLYWAHWLYRMYDQADMHHEEQLQVLVQTLRAVTERLGDVDTRSASSLAGAAGELGLPPPPALPTRTSGYVATMTGSVYHLPSCPVVAHHPEGLRTLGTGDLSGLEPCRICLPDKR